MMADQLTSLHYIHVCLAVIGMAQVFRAVIEVGAFVTGLKREDRGRQKG